MRDVFAPLERDDYPFLVGLLTGGLNLNLVDDGQLRRLLAEYEAEGSADARAALDAALEREIRYLGSAELGYLFRSLSGGEPGAPFAAVVRDVARALKVDPPPPGPAREQVERVVERYVSQRFATMTPEQQQQMLVDLGVEQEKATAFLKRSAGVFTLPLLVEAFGLIVVDGLIKRVIFGTIAKVIGAQLAGQLFRFVAGRLPWWVAWIGPAAWTLSLSWTAFDLQGPALRKTIPTVLYLGLCSLRHRRAAAPPP